MRIRMTNPAYSGVANVLPDDVPAWEAAGWVADKPARKATNNKETSK